MISIDGSGGEGGGQIQSTALALSMVAGKPSQSRVVALLLAEQTRTNHVPHEDSFIFLSSLREEQVTPLDLLKK